MLLRLHLLSAEAVVAARRVRVATTAVRTAVVAILWVRLDEHQVARRVHAGHEEAARLLLQAHLHRVALLLHLPLHIAARRIGLLEQREVARVVYHLHAEASEDSLIAAALVLVDERARAVLLVMEIAAALIALLLAHAVELALGNAVRRGVELLTQVHRVVHDALGALRLVRHLLGLQRSLLGLSHHL